MIKAIIFDCFGVLVGRGFDETYSLAGGNPAKDEEFINDTLAEANLGTITPSEMQQKMTHKLRITEKEWDHAVAQAEQPNTELLEIIPSLKKMYKLAILSNANTGTLERMFVSDQLLLFDVVVVSAEVGMVKPQPEIYVYTAEKLGVEVSECVFVDDIQTYVAAAQALGMMTIHYKSFHQFRSQLDQLLSTS